jgi:L-iditol 2-dehydrogenase
MPNSVRDSSSLIFIAIEFFGHNTYSTLALIIYFFSFTGQSPDSNLKYLSNLDQQMLQSLLTEPLHIKLTTSMVPRPGENDVLIRLHMVGVCGSDVHMFKNGHSFDGPLTIGHEGLGVIVNVGSGINEERVGERVVIEPNIPCLHCPECRKGKGNICRNKRKIGVSEHGCFAEYVAVPGEFAHRLHDSIADQDAVVIEPMVVALSALKRSNIKPGETIAVIGLGAIGMLLTHAARTFGYRVLVTDLVDSKIKMAVEMGAESISGDLETAYQKAEVAAVFECAGSGKSATLAIQSAPRGADVIVLGLSEDPASFSPRLLSQKGNSIIPSLIYDHPVDFQRCIYLVEKGIIKPGFVVTRYYSLEELPEALKEAQKGEEGKIVIRMSDH